MYVTQHLITKIDVKANERRKTSLPTSTRTSVRNSALNFRILFLTFGWKLPSKRVGVSVGFPLSSQASFVANTIKSGKNGLYEP